MNIHTHFYSLADHAQSLATAHEVILVNFSAEQTHFVRFNRALVRQAMQIEQAGLSIALIVGQRKVEKSISLNLNQSDLEAITQAVNELRALLPLVPEDPHLLYATEVHSSQQDSKGDLPKVSEVIDAVTQHAKGLDFVGLYASGPIMCGFANSLGQRNWHSVESFSLEWCVYSAAPGRGDKAVKTSYSGQRFELAAFKAKLEQARQRVARLADTPKTISPGEYRVLLSADAVSELLQLMCWGGFSEKGIRTKQSPLVKLYEGEEKFSPLMSLREDVSTGLDTAFDDAGFVRTPVVELVKNGMGSGRLVSARTAKEYNIAGNGASDAESPSVLMMSPGTLAQSQQLATLDTGLLISNLWYTNYSDRQNCRVTGMTRFSCFWVERGELVAPLNVMRFDDSLFRVFGSKLEALGDQAELMPNTDSYESRSLGAFAAPAALVNDFRLTL
jgi:predicted Zn-dependent protease